MAEEEDQAADLLQQWERALELEKDKKRQHDDLPSTSSRLADGRDWPQHTEMERVVMSPRAPRHGAAESPRERRPSMQYGSTAMYRAEAHDGFIKKVMQMNESSPGPVGSKSTRRNSYSVGYASVGSPGALPDNIRNPGKPIELVQPSAQVPAGGRTGSFVSVTSDGGLSLVQKGAALSGAAHAIAAEHQQPAPGIPLSAVIRGSSTPNAGAAALPGGIAPHGAGETPGIGGKIKKLITRTISRRNLASKLQPQSNDATPTKATPMLHPPPSLTHHDLCDELDELDAKTGGTHGFNGDSDRSSSQSQGALINFTPDASKAPVIPIKKATTKPGNNHLRTLITLSPFVPRLLIEEIVLDEPKYSAFDEGGVRELVTASKALKPSMQEFQGAVMIADVKGFTQLTEILSKKGTAGVELLTNCMNNYFTRVINMILAFDGDVVKFAGDSMIVVFSPTPNERDEEDQGIHAATLRCAQCAHVLASRLGHMRMKMNGQVEPINVQTNSDLIEPEDTTRLKFGSGHMHSNVPLSPDPRSLLAMQHAAQQVAAMRMSTGTGSDSTGSGVKSLAGSGRGSPVSAEMVGGLLHHIPPDTPPINPALLADMAGGEPVANYGPDGSSHGTPSTAPGTPASGGMPYGLTKSMKKGNWISSMMKKPGKKLVVETGGSSASLAGATASVSAASSVAMSHATAALAGALRGKKQDAANSPARLVQTDSSLWVEGGGMVRREMSLASKLNIPPPVRVIGPSTSRASLQVLPGASDHILPGVQQTQCSFTDSGEQINRLIAPLAAGMRRGPTESWASKFQHLSSGVTGSEAPLAIERSNTSVGNVRPMMSSWDNQIDGEETGPKSNRAQQSNSEEFKPSASAPSKSRLGAMKTMKSLGRKQASIGNQASGHRRTASQDSSLAGAESVEPPEAGLSPGRSEAIRPAPPPDGPVEWSEDSYAVDALTGAATSFTNTAAAKRANRKKAEPVASIDGYMAPGTPGSQPLGEGHEPDSLQSSQHLTESFTQLGPRANSSPQQLTGGRWSIAHHDDSWLSAGSATTMPCPSRGASQLFGFKSGWLPRASRLMLDSSASFVCRTLHETYSGPVAEGMFKVAHDGDSRPGSGMDPGGHAQDPMRTPDGKHGLMGKMMNWLGGSTIKRGSLASGHMDFRNDERDDDSGQDDSPPVAAFGYQNPRLATPGTGYTKTRDPVMEEVQNSEFSLKIMISAGTVSVFQVGGLIDEVTDPTMPEVPHWEFFIGDTPLAPLRDQYDRRRCIAQLALIEDQAEAGTVVCSREVMNLLQDEWDIDLLEDDVGMMKSTKQSFIIPSRLHQPILRTQKDGFPLGRQPSGKLSTSPALDTAQDASQPIPEEDAPDGQTTQHELASLSEEHQRRLAGVLRMHVLGSVRSRIEAGHLDFVNEIRPLTCLFLGFPSLLQERLDATHDEQVSCVQYSMQQVQHVMRKWDGSLLQFRCDEKGYLGICAFGLPGHTHEDNPSRAILAALELQRRIKEKSHVVCIGVTTGDLLCTCVGARKIRSEYTVFGDAINLSARLMVKCKSGMAEILCDEPTYTHAKFKASFEELQPLPVKGKKLPVHVFSVTPFNKETAAAAAVVDPANAMNEAHGGQRVAGGAPERPLVGRDTETSFILNRAANMIAGMATGGAIVIEGNTGMGKTKLLNEVRRSLERIHSDTASSGAPVFHLFFGVADIANKNTKLHPWRRTFQELFATDRDRSAVPQQQEGEAGSPDAAAVVSSPVTALGNRLAAHIPSYNADWSKHLADLLELPLATIPMGTHTPSDDFVTPASGEKPHAQHLLPDQLADAQLSNVSGREKLQSNGGNGGNVSADGLLRALAGSRNLTNMAGNTSMRTSRPAAPTANHTPSSGSTAAPASLSGAQNQLDVLVEGPQTGSNGSKDLSTVDKPLTLPSAGNKPGSVGLGAGSVGLGTVGPAPGASNSISVRRSPSHTPLMGSMITGIGGAPPTLPNATAVTNTNTGTAPAPLKKNSLNFLVHVIREYTALYGPMIIMLENLHEFDTWSWQLLVKVAEVLSPAVLILATTRPNELSPTTPGQSHGKLALYQKVAMMYRHLLKLPTTSKVHLQPFTFLQTKALMQVVADNHYPDQYVLAVMEKTGGMPLYIEKVTEFLCQKPWLADQGGEFTANVNKMIRNLNFQQVIIERMDRLKPGIHLSLKVASVMGQWVDLDILHKFYPISKSKDELRSHLVELERGNFLKPTDTEGVWEFNMVERDIVYEVIPHYQRRRLHAKLAQELERSLEEQHVATLTTIAYHWNQACMGHEVTEVECALKAIEYWHRAAEAGYSGSSLMEALRLYQKAAQIAELLADSMGDSFQAPASRRASLDSGDVEVTKRPKVAGMEGGDDMDDANASFTAVGAAFRGQLNWSLVSRITRAQWEKSMASCCLGIVMQHRLEFNNQMEFWDSEDYFTLLTEHAIRGLMLLGAPHPQDVLLQDRQRSGLARLLCCFQSEPEEPSGWREGVVLQDQEVTEIRDILLVLIIAAEHYSLQQDGDEYTRLLTFCKRVCIFFMNCSDSGLDPFTDIQLACTSRIKTFKSRKGVAAVADFELGAADGELLDEGDDGSQFDDGLGVVGALDPHRLSSALLTQRAGNSWHRGFN